MASEVLGTDIYLSLTLNDIEFDQTGDFRIISGRDNMIQAIFDRLRTLRGELVLEPDYGTLSPILLGFPMPVGLAFLRNEIRETLLQDPRINEVLDIQLSVPAVDTINASITVTLIDSETPLNLVYPFDLANL